MTTTAKHDWENRSMMEYLPAEQEIRRTIRDSYPHEGNGRSQHRLNYKPRHCRQFETEEELNNWLADGNELETVNELGRVKCKNGADTARMILALNRPVYDSVVIYDFEPRQ